MTSEEKVLHGERLLDAIWGSEGWRSGIVADDIDMAHPGKCVLSHLKGDYATGISWLRLHGASDEDLSVFEPTTCGEDDHMSRLWKKRIGAWQNQGQEIAA